MSEVTLLPNRSVAPKQDIVARSVGDEMVLLDLASGSYFTLNGVGAFIWRQIEDQADVDAIATRIVEEYEVDLDQARSDASAFLSNMLEQGIVEVS